VVKVGDFVKKGDVLIQGVRHFNDDTTQDVYAIGKVVVVKSVTAFAPYTGTKTVLEPTGNHKPLHKWYFVEKLMVKVAIT
ncbi:MAG: sporulation protein YqfD, partial [Clostridia bacterium]|nr:sporulation protein YqfD [Clostridia bacterium]